MSGDKSVPRPLKKTEFEVVFITREAEKGWRDLLAVARNATVEAWECLTTEPDVETKRLYILKHDYATGDYEGVTYARYQYKVTDGARIWYFIRRSPKGGKIAGQVLLERCMPAHPKETD